MTNESNYTGKHFGSYCLEKEIARGSFGVVYLARHAIITKYIVVVKLLDFRHLGSQKELDGFQDEAQILAELTHPHILPFKDYGVQEGLPYLVVEYATKGSLRDRLQQIQRPNLLPTEDALTILSQVGQALQFAHQHKPESIVHRDLKPSNILFNAKGEALLADFGIARALPETGIKFTEAIGTPPYMAPEQFQGSISVASDQYSLGCIAYELFTGHLPFKGDTAATFMHKHLTENPKPPRELNSSLPEHIEHAILKAMAKQRADRHADISAFIEALTDVSKPISIESDFWNEPTEPNSRALKSSFEIEPTEPEKTQEQWLQEGNDYYGAKHYDEALMAYEQAIRLNPNNATFHRNKGNALKMLGRNKEAVLAYEQAIQLDPKNATFYRNKGNLFLILKQYQEAVQSYEQAIRIESKNKNAYLGKGEALCGLAHFEKALEAYEQALEIDPGSVSANLGKGNALHNLKRYDEAFETYERTIRLDPSNAILYVNEGDVLYDLKRYEEALASYELATRLDPNNADVQNKAGNVLHNLKRYEQALIFYQRAIHLSPNSTQAYNNKGNVLRSLKRYREALLAYEQALRLDSNNAVFLTNKGNILRDLERNQEALVGHLSIT